MYCFRNRSIRPFFETKVKFRATKPPLDNYFTSLKPHLVLFKILWLITARNSQPSSSKGCTTFIDELSPIRHALDWLYLNSNPSGKRPHGQLPSLHDRFVRCCISSQWFPWLHTHYTFLCGTNVKSFSKSASHNQRPSLSFFIVPHYVVLVL